MMGELDLFGCGFKGCADAVYHSVSKVLDALVQWDVVLAVRKRMLRTPSAPSSGGRCRRALWNMPQSSSRPSILFMGLARGRGATSLLRALRHQRVRAVPDGTQLGDVSVSKGTGVVD